MPATTPNPAKVAQNGTARHSEQGGPLYVNCDLNKEQKAHLAEWANDLEWVDLYKWVDDMVANNCVISLKVIPGTTGFQCAITGTQGSTKEGKCLMSRASTATKALVSAMYKDVVVLQSIWTAVRREEEYDL